ncbi:MAG TPA: hypothetical protein VKV26_07240 [Dehalococcoidia bacterium]|nr:hypothetical protein [Dehalococcoidia bacterium]
MNRWWIPGMGVLAVAVGVIAAPAAFRAVTGPAQAQTAPSIIGSWLITIARPGLDPNSHQVVSYTADGIVLASHPPISPPTPQQDPNATRSYSTAGQGTWVAAGAGQVRYKWLAVQTDEEGNFAGLMQITGTVTLAGDGNSTSEVFQVLITGADGTVLFDSHGDAGTVQGTRITV